MSIPIKTPEEIYQQIKADLQQNFTSKFIPRAVVDVFVRVVSYAIYSVYKTLQYVQQQAFFTTATDIETIKIKASEDTGLTLKEQGTGSDGSLSIQGDVNAIVPIDAEFIDNTGSEYKTTAETELLQQTISITSILRSAGRVTVTTSAPHKLSSQNTVNIANVVPTSFNATSLNIFVINSASFSYLQDGIAESGSGGDVSFVSGLLLVKATTLGEKTNLSSGSSLTLQNPLVVTGTVNSTAFVSSGGLTGGTEPETTEQFVQRNLRFSQRASGVFGDGWYENLAESVVGVEKAWCPRNTTQLGKIYIYIRPSSAGIISSVVDKVLDGNISPAITTQELFVQAPTEVPIPIQITSLSPDNATVRQTIEENYTKYFLDNLNVGETPTQSDILAVFKLITVSGTSLSGNATATIPTINFGEIAVNGVISYV